MTQNKAFKKHHLGAALVLSASIISSGLGSRADGVGAQTARFADAAFQRVWEHTDVAVAQGRVNRTWMWGPAPGASLQEPFKEGPGGQHLVQYFDKARMEINNPSLNPSDPNYVTNGLLVVEMISGRIQIGAKEFEDLGASDDQIAGDPGSDAPTYAGLRGVAAAGVAPEAQATPIAPGLILRPWYIDRNGMVSNGIPVAKTHSSVPVVYTAGYISQTGHNLADVFVTYMNSRGLVYENGRYVNGLLMNWVSALGYPVTDPFWTYIKVGSNYRMVLFQAFQRRILTYTPDNPDGWKVEMGNVGAQYYDWRYKRPAAINCSRVPVRGFGRVWADHRAVQATIGCPYDAEKSTQTAYQSFEGGIMLWVNRETYVHQQLIYVFFNDGTVQQFDDTWSDGQPANAGLAPPSGLYEPQRGFGKVWREGTGARVRERLGWATALEKGGQGAYQLFEHGEMYWTGAVNKIFVLYARNEPFPNPGPGPIYATPGPGGLVYRYDVFDDTFGP
jgi:hypothetical protein